MEERSGITIITTAQLHDINEQRRKSKGGMRSEHCLYTGFGYGDSLAGHGAQGGLISSHGGVAETELSGAGVLFELPPYLARTRIPLSVKS